MRWLLPFLLAGILLGAGSHPALAAAPGQTSPVPATPGLVGGYASHHLTAAIVTASAVKGVAGGAAGGAWKALRGSKKGQEQ